MQLSFEALSIVVDAASPQTLLEDLAAPEGRHLPVRRRVWSGARVDLLFSIGRDLLRVPTLACGSSERPEGVVVRIPRMLPDRGVFALPYVQALLGGPAAPKAGASTSFVADDGGLSEIALFACGERARVPLVAALDLGERLEIAAGSPRGDRVVVVNGRVEDVISDDGSVALVTPWSDADVAAAARFAASHGRAPSTGLFSTSAVH